MRTIYFISCVSKKAATPATAAELYQSDWFIKARGYVLKHLRSGDAWFILSAKHHLVRPDQILKPYAQTLNAMGKKARLEWSQQVLREIYTVLRPRDKVVILAGERYREYLETALRRSGWQVTVPMRGLSIGKQLRWLGNNLEATARVQ